jgi:maltose alpha-D-glucosyltransferase/alpha-amylase
VFDAFGPEKNMQLYNRGIRLRLAPMFKNDPKLLRMVYSFLFALPGDPMIRYGDEIGMGSDLNLKERMAVRTPMQWNDSANAGFSTGTNTVRPVISDGVFGYKNINVKAEQTDSASLLNFIIKMGRLRKNCSEISWGNWQFLNTGSAHVIAIRYDWNGTSLITVHNFSKEPQQIKLDTENKATGLQDLLNNSTVPVSGNTINLSVAGYGYNWYKIKSTGI